MDTTQWPQGIGVVKQPSMEAARGVLTTTDQQQQQQQQSKRPRPQKEQALNCPRCNSTNTKFCYYNNYSLTQPRYFCKTCRRYWTEGGTLRNVPVGGGSRKNIKRSTPTSPSSPSSSSAKKLLIPHGHPPPPHMMVVGPQNPRIQQLGGGGCQDLNLAYPPISSNTTTTATTNGGDYHMIFNPNPNLNSAVEFLKSGANGVGSFVPISVTDSGAGIFPPGFHMQEFKPSLNFSIDGGFGNGYEGVHQESGGGARLFFPFEEVKQSTSAPNTSGGDQFDEHEDQQEIQRGQQGEANGYWSGMLGGGHGGSW